MRLYELSQVQRGVGEVVGSIAELCKWSLMPQVKVGKTVADLAVGGKGSETNELGGGEGGAGALGTWKSDVIGRLVSGCAAT